MNNIRLNIFFAQYTRLKREIEIFFERLFEWRTMLEKAGKNYSIILRTRDVIALAMV
jgi:hypothetical protein